MRVPATDKRLKENPNPKFVSKCSLVAFEIALYSNACLDTGGDGRTLFAKPNHDTMIGPRHVCNYVDVFVVDLDKGLVSYHWQ